MLLRFMVTLVGRVFKHYKDYYTNGGFRHIIRKYDDKIDKVIFKVIASHTLSQCYNYMNYPSRSTPDENVFEEDITHFFN